MFETTKCSRCMGSGHYSRCEMYGTTCFGCHGTGKVLSKRGRAALARFVVLTTRTFPNAAIRPIRGDDELKTAKAAALELQA